MVWKYQKYTAAFINMNFFPLLLASYMLGTSSRLEGRVAGEPVRVDIRPSLYRGPRRRWSRRSGARGGRPDPKLPRPRNSGDRPSRRRGSGSSGNEPRRAWDDSTADHIRNFLDCVKSRRKPDCHIDMGFHRRCPASSAYGGARGPQLPRDEGADGQAGLIHAAGAGPI